MLDTKWALTGSQAANSSHASSKNGKGSQDSDEEVMEVDDDNRKRPSTAKDSDTSDLSFDEEEQMRERVRLEAAKKAKRSTSRGTRARK
jgi:hypothetical protein